MTELVFDHVGSFHSRGRLLLCDVEWLDPKFAGMRSGQVLADFEIEVEAGTWQALVARQSGRDAIEFVVLSHDDELEQATPLERAESIALLRIDSGRVSALDPRLRHDQRVRTTLLATPADELPAMVTLPEDEEPSGTVIDIDVRGTFAVYAAPGHPRRAIFLAVAG